MNHLIAFVKALFRHYLTKERAEVGMAICGLVALVTPLLLWVSWSTDMLKGILTMGFASFILATWFAQYACPEALDPDQELLPKPGEIPLPDNKGQTDPFFSTNDVFENIENPIKMESKKEEK